MVPVEAVLERIAAEIDSWRDGWRVMPSPDMRRLQLVRDPFDHCRIHLLVSCDGDYISLSAETEGKPRTGDRWVSIPTLISDEKTRRAFEYIYRQLDAPR